MKAIALGLPLVAIALFVGCSRKSDNAAMQPVSHEHEGGGAFQSGGGGGGGAALEEPDWPSGGSTSPLTMAEEHADEATDDGPYFSMAEPPEEEPPYAMAEPAGEEAPSGVPRAPETSAPRETAAPRMVPRMSIRSSPPEQGDFRVVEVFYGTDRARLSPAQFDLADYLRHYRAAVGFLAATLVLSGSLLLGQKRKFAFAAGAIGVVLAIGMGLWGMTKTVHSRHLARGEIVQYGDSRGVLEMGVAEVSIPKDHRVGELEAPSMLRLEFSEDPTRHVMVLQAKTYSQEEFFRLLRDSVGSASRRELLVFIHGYNVSFEDALRRTAQIAADVKFPGAAVCYSWPSTGALLAYTADENNVEWTVPHFKEFLTQLREQSGAEAINLVGHSMGTRALGDALREFARETEEQGKLFNQVVLAAPDIDAEVFRRDIAPALTKTANRVTLYASSNDQALIASRKLHAYPRAGESGANLVVAPGVDTIDVSAIDTSLLGHSYYGDNDSIISDLYHLVHDALPPSQRERLEAAALNGLPYWIFTTAAARVANPGERATQ
jgi:esterase/lipase superfamily enzyme